jgi:hypothetical protein
MANDEAEVIDQNPGIPRHGQPEIQPIRPMLLPASPDLSDQSIILLQSTRTFRVIDRDDSAGGSATRDMPLHNLSRRFV